jgi:DNA-binding NtrC family response regulator
LVEDEAMVAMLIEDMLAELGCASIWHAGSVEQALRLLRERWPTVGVLDVNLAGEAVFPIAEYMHEARIPFVFATGYGSSGIPEIWHSKAILRKPFTLEHLRAGLQASLDH